VRGRTGMSLADLYRLGMREAEEVFLRRMREIDELRRKATRRTRHWPPEGGARGRKTAPSQGQGATVQEKLERFPPAVPGGDPVADYPSLDYFKPRPELPS
jgi:hypothetical protein